MTRRANAVLSGWYPSSYERLMHYMYRRSNPQRKILEVPLAVLVENILRSQPDLLSHTLYEDQSCPFRGLAEKLTATFQDLFVYGVDKQDFDSLSSIVQGDRLRLLKQVGTKLMNELRDRNRVATSQVPRLLWEQHSNDALVPGSERMVFLQTNQLRGFEQALINKVQEDNTDVFERVIDLPFEKDAQRKPSSSSDQSSTGKSGLDFLKNSLFQSREQTIPWEKNNGVTFVSAPDRHREAFFVGEAIGKKMREATTDSENGHSLSFSDVGVFVPSGEDRLLVMDTLQSMGIPVFAPGGISLKHFSIGRCFQSYLDIFRHNFRRDCVMDFCTNPLVSMDWLDFVVQDIMEEYDDLSVEENQVFKNGLSTHRWQQFSIQAEVDRGQKDWLEKLDRFEDRAFQKRGRAVLRSKFGPDENGLGRANRNLLEKLIFTRSMRKLLEKLNGIHSQTGNNFVHSCFDLFQGCLDSDASGVGTVFDPEPLNHSAARRELEKQTREMIHEIDWDRFGNARGDMLDRMEQVLEQSVSVGEGFESGAVFLGTPESAAGHRFDTVYLLGVNERVFPSPAKEDPFLLDRERERLESEELDFDCIGPTSDDRDQETKRTFWDTVQASGSSLYVSYRRMSDDSNAERIPSSFFLDSLNTYEAEEESDDIHDDPRVKRVPLEYTPYSGQSMDAIHSFQFGLHSSSRTHQNKTPVEESLRVSYAIGAGNLHRQIQKDHQSWESPEWTPSDGCFDDPELGKRIRDHVLGEEARPFSPYRLGSFYECPRKFLFNSLLGFEETNLPETSIQMDAASTGGLVHRLLENVTFALREQHLLGSDVSFEDKWKSVKGVIRKILRDYEKHHSTGLPTLWNIQKASCISMVKKAIEFMSSDSGFVPVVFEWSSRSEPVHSTLSGWVDERFHDRGLLPYQRRRLSGQVQSQIGKNEARSSVVLSLEEDGTQERALDWSELQKQYVRMLNEEDDGVATVSTNHGTTIQLGGKIDRIDQKRSNTDVYRVVDYKTGSSYRYDSGCFLNEYKSNGEKFFKHQLQLPVYWLLVEQNFDATVAEALYLFLNDGRGVTIENLDRTEWEERLCLDFERSLSRFENCLRESMFPAVPQCAYCPSETICGIPEQREHLMEQVKDANKIYERFLEAALPGEENDS